MSARFILLAASAMALAACGGAPEYRPIVATTADLHKPVVTQELARLDLLPAYNGLSPTDRPAIAAFLQEYGASARGPLVVSAPPGEDASLMADDVLAVAAGLGMTRPQIALAVSAPDGGSPYNLTFLRFYAHIEQCGQVWESLAQTSRSQTFTNFGCAHNANLAAMIADPADLVAPRAVAPADAQRRSTVLQAYRLGESTASVRDDADSAAVSGD